MKESIEKALRELRLSGMKESLDIRLQEAAVNQLDYSDFLELILQDEMTVRKNRLIKRRIKAASFHNLKPIDNFDWNFNPGIDKKKIFELATCNFIPQAKDVLFIGPPGIGKTFLAQAIGYQAVKQGYTVLYKSIFDMIREFIRDEAFAGENKTLGKYLKVDLLIIDDMGLKQLPKRSGEFLFEVIMRRYELKSTIMTSNRPIEDWGKLIGDVPTAGAILDRFLHNAEVIPMMGKSYRLKYKSENNGSLKSNLFENKQ